MNLKCWLRIYKQCGVLRVELERKARNDECKIPDNNIARERNISYLNDISLFA